MFLKKKVQEHKEFTKEDIDNLANNLLKQNLQHNDSVHSNLLKQDLKEIKAKEKRNKKAMKIVKKSVK